MKNMIKSTDLDDLLINILIDHTGEDVDLDTNIADIGLDSLDAVEISMKIEKDFDITLNDDEFEMFSLKNKIKIKDIKVFLRKYGVFDVREERKRKIEKIDENK